MSFLPVLYSSFNKNLHEFSRVQFESNFQTQLVSAMYRGKSVFSAEQHSDKKLLERYDKDSESGHHWLPKLRNHAESLAIEKSE